MVKLSVDDLINTFERLNGTSSILSSELGEQDAGDSGGGSGSPNPTKWESQYQTKRGPANQIKVTKWRDSYQTGRGVANNLF